MKNETTKSGAIETAGRWHSAEPWKVLDDTYNSVVSEYGSIVAMERTDCGEPMLRADSERIVACVNACAGMANPAAELAALRACREVLAQYFAVDAKHPHDSGDTIARRYNARAALAAAGKAVQS